MLKEPFSSVNLLLSGLDSGDSLLEEPFFLLNLSLSGLDSGASLLELFSLLNLSLLGLDTSDCLLDAGFEEFLPGYEILLLHAWHGGAQ